MQSTPRSGYRLGPSGSSPPKVRPSAMKRTISTSSQLNARVQFTEDAIGSIPEPVSPRSRSRVAARSFGRFNDSPELQETESSASIIGSSLPKSRLAEEAEARLEGVSKPAIRVTNPPPTPDDEHYESDSVDNVKQTRRVLGAQSSVRACSSDVEADEVLRNIMETLRVRKIPGPQLFRWETEFKKPLGEGGEGSVRGTNESVNERINDLKLGKTERPKWDKFAIKRHRVPGGIKSVSGLKSSPKAAEAVKACLEAAEAEIKALSHLLRGQRNIVQLRGWGLCLDTLEKQNPSEPQADMLFSNLQLPLLVLERGDGDLEQFLKHVFDCDDEIQARGDSLESIAEEGRFQAAMPAFPSPEPGSFSGSTLNEDETMTQYDPNPESQEISSHSSQFWIINGMNRHEVLRRLCIDIGHGLRALHDINMTHGDLKPQNVLVFREGPMWIAKLCDFGHSNSFDSSKNDAVYLGTPNWRPHWFGDSGKKHDIATLQDFGLTVYGLLVWSAFCPSLRGRAPRVSGQYRKANPHELFKNHLQEMIPIGCGQRILGGKAAMVRRVDRLVRGTVCASYDRYAEDKAGVHRPVQRPWEKLYNKTVRATRSFWTSASATKRFVRHKAHGECSATGSDSETASRDAAGTQSRRHSNTSLISAQDKTAMPSWDIDDSDGETTLYDNLWRLILKTSRDPVDHAILYSQARLRATRVESAIWRNGTRRNIVEEALKSRPPLDIYTIAWLCKGDAGAEEVRSLPADYSTWELILAQDVLNESERLERFLLLMQFGAPIEQRLDGHPEMKSPRSILSTYLHTCRLSIRAVVSDEICRRYERILAIAAPDTRYYMTAARECRPCGMSDDFETVATSTALGNINLDRREHKAAYPFLKLNFEQLLDKQNDIYRAYARRPSHTSVNETTPLLAAHHRNLQRNPRSGNEGGKAADGDRKDVAGLPLPPLEPSLPGWSECGGAFINELTGSVTLKRPTLGLAQMRRINIGHLGSQNVLEIDLADFLLPPDPSSSASEREEDPHMLRERIKKRFPPFDENWFYTKGWGDAPPSGNDEDVLGAIRDHSKWEQEPAQTMSSTFEIKPPEFSADVFLSKNFSTLLFFIQYPARG